MFSLFSFGCDCKIIPIPMLLNFTVGTNCTTKLIAKTATDPECFHGTNARAECADRGSCFEQACCCDDPAYDNNNKCYDLDECDSNPCKNGGTCTNQHNFYQCECTEGE